MANMAPFFQEFYSQHLEEYLGGQDGDTINIVNEAIDYAVDRLENRKVLRSDARLFLTINLHEIVAIPLSQQNSPTRLTADIVGELREDTYRILQAASLRAGNREELAASHIVWGLAFVLDDLNLKNWRFWDPI